VLVGVGVDSGIGVSASVVVAEGSNVDEEQVVGVTETSVAVRVRDGVGEWNMGVSLAVGDDVGGAEGVGSGDADGA